MRHIALNTGFALLAALFIGCSKPAQTPEDMAGNIEVSWTWKRTANEDANVVYGSVKNKGDRALREVVLEFRTQNREGQIVNTHDFSLQDLLPGAEKLFTKDYPAQAALEDSGFVRVKRVIPAD